MGNIARVILACVYFVIAFVLFVNVGTAHVAPWATLIIANVYSAAVKWEKQEGGGNVPDR